MKNYISFILFILFIYIIVKILTKKPKNKSDIQQYNNQKSYCNYCGKEININSKFCCYCGKNIENININAKRINYIDYYIPKRYIITMNELILYRILLEIAKELNLILLCQVSLYSILRPKNNNYTYFNKISSKSIDFVLVRQNDCRIKLCIELDDNTHNYPDRIKRDKFINELFKDLNINLLRIKSQSAYNKEILKEQILKYVKEDISF